MVPEIWCTTDGQTDGKSDISGFELVKQNRFTKKSSAPRKKGLKKFLDWQIIL